MRFPASLLVASWVLWCGAHSVSAGATPGPAVSPGAEATPGPIESTPAVEWDVVLLDLELRFYDPGSSRTFTATGPFEILEESAGRVVARGAATGGNGAPQVTIVSTDAGLWVVARFGPREFAARIR